MKSFYGREHASPEIISLYEDLLHIWQADTCAPRMRAQWSQNNPTLGQCSITAFIAQDLFGGDVYGIPLGDGTYHCFNIIDGAVIDLTSEQFGNKILDYENRTEQLRETHLSKPVKRERYELLKSRLLAYRSGR
ncbi:MAG: hypothetical protein II784_01825 [Oscillospiraceae bacterium]|nr:hypothetical protein [Oscillospiraceae bacterium]